MLWILIVLMSIVLAYLCRAIDIYVAFRSAKINLTMLNCLKILYYFTILYAKQLKLLRGVKRKELNRIYWLHFDILVEMLITICVNSLN